ncbi:MAG: biotin transporter BioY [Bacteroidota bacterium]|jgi:biotin transport system substrate-specific component
MEVVKKTYLSFSLTSNSIIAQIMWISAFAVLTIAGAKIEIPHYPVPFTLQTFFVLLSGAFLGSRNGSLSQVVYLSLGAIGIPVFAGMDAGIVKLFGPTAGYLFSFPVAAACVGYLVRLRSELWWTVVSFSVGLIMIFVSGSLFLQATVFHDWNKTIVSGLLIFSWWDIVKLAAAATIHHEFSKRFKTIPQ